MVTWWKQNGGSSRNSRSDSKWDEYGLAATDKMFRFRVTIDMSFRFRFALLLCAFIILVNVLFKVQTDFVEMAIFKQRKVVVYQPSAVDNSDSIDLRFGLNGDNMMQNLHREQDIKNQFPHHVADKQIQNNHKIEANLDIANRHLGQSDESLQIANIAEEKPVAERCQTGHIPGLPEICDGSGCLRKLTISSDTKTKSRPDPVPANIRRLIDYIPGWLDSTHFSIIPFLTEMQWAEGIHGSVGELVAGLGKLTSLLTFNVDHSAGEILFVSDDFIRSLNKYVPQGETTLYDKFVSYMSKCGYAVTDLSLTKPTSLLSSSKTVYVHQGNAMDLHKQLFQQWDIPQFRLIALDGDSGEESMTSLSGLIVSSCVLRDGGMIVVDGVDSHESSQHMVSSLSHYFTGIQHEKIVLTPLLKARNKLYLTTVGYKQRYTDYLLKHSEKELGVTLKPVKSDYYGVTLTYLSMD